MKTKNPNPSTFAPDNNGNPIVCCINEPKPILGAPPGKQRLRMRNDQLTELFVLTQSGVRRFFIKDCGSHWEPIYEMGRNMTVQESRRNIAPVGFTIFPNESACSQ